MYLLMMNLNILMVVILSLIIIMALSWNSFDPYFFNPKPTDKKTQASHTEWVNGLPVFIYEPQSNEIKGTILFFHANPKNAVEYEEHILWLVEDGYRVVSKEYRGYYKDTGKPKPKNTIRSCEMFLAWAISRYPEKLHIKGHSIGGHLALRAYINLGMPTAIESIKLEGSFLCCKTVGAQRAIKRFFFFKYIKGKSAEMLARTLAFWLLSSHLVIKEKEIDKIDIRVLVVVATNDRYINYQNSLRISEVLSDAELVLLPHGRHVGNITKEKHRPKYLDFLSK